MENKDEVIDFRDLQRAVREHDNALGMLTAFRHAANSLALEAGIIVSHVPHDEAGKSVIGDIYFLQLLAESELRMRTLSTGYEKLRAAVSRVASGEITGPSAVRYLTEALDNDLS